MAYMYISHFYSSKMQNGLFLMVALFFHFVTYSHVCLEDRNYQQAN